jgi:uridine phosphorylase
MENSGQSFIGGYGGVAKFNNKMRLVGQNSNFYKMNNSYKRNEVTVKSTELG